MADTSPLCAIFYECNVCKQTTSITNKMAAENVKIFCLNSLFHFITYVESAFMLRKIGKKRIMYRDSVEQNK